MENSEQIRKRIKAEARKGDYVEVADTVGLKPDTVHKVVNGARNNARALEAFVKLLDDRAERMEQFKTGEEAK